jgi:hypothetical protein
MMSFWSLKEQTDCKSRRLDQRQCQKSNYRRSSDKSQHEKSFQQEIPIEQKQETQRKEKEKKKKRKEWKSEIRLEQPCIFGPEHLSGKFLESKFGILFRPNVANNTRSCLCNTKCSASTTV